jgi:glycosyltransferase involved in cell wall biosynthesis
MSEDEGFCLPVIEAMLAGLPVFAYAVPALVEVLDGSGFTFSDKNFRILAHEVNTLIRTDRSSMVNAQLRRAETLVDSMDGGLFMDLLFS